MNKIKYRLDKRCLIEVDGGLTEVDYSSWPVDETEKELSIEEVIWDGEKVVDNRLEVAKEKQKQIISEAFENNLQNGFFTSEALGIQVDYRRSGVKMTYRTWKLLLLIWKKK